MDVLAEKKSFCVEHAVVGYYVGKSNDGPSSSSLALGLSFPC